MHQEYKIETIKTKNGLSTMKINGYLLSSKYNPKLEAEKFIEQHYKPEHIHILFGYGAGYIPNLFLNRLTHNEKLIIFEPILKEININSYKSNLILIENGDFEQLKNIIKQRIKITDKITIICSPNYDRICPEKYKNFLSELKDKLMLDKVVENTIVDMSEQWQKNYLLNLQYILKDQTIKKLEKHVSVPVVIAAGGPSLTKQLPLVKKYRNNFILIAAGSTINTLINASIEPDYIISIDGHELNYEHFKDLEFKNAKLIYSMYNYYAIRNSFNNIAYYFLTPGDKEIFNHLKGIVKDEIVQLPGGGSVAHYALSVANYISSGPIALIGQDLAYTNNQSHAISNKGMKIISEDDIRTKGLFYTKGYYGDEVLTDYPFLSMKKTFEELITAYNENSSIFNCTEGGVCIEGLSQLPFEVFCEKYASNKISKVVIKDAKRDIRCEVEFLIQKMKKEIEIYDKLKYILIDNLALLTKNKSSVVFEKFILEKLDKNDNKIEEYLLQTALSISMDSINLQVLKNFKPPLDETEKEAYNRVYNQNKTLYKEYFRAVENAKEYTSLLIEFLKMN